MMAPSEMPCGVVYNVVHSFVALAALVAFVAFVGDGWLSRADVADPFPTNSPVCDACWRRSLAPEHGSVSILK